jgi:hypothetical protein
VYSYQLAVKSKQGGVTYHLESGPEGMEVSPGGKVRWKVPPGAEGAAEHIIISVKDAAGQKCLHSFQVRVVDR